MFERSRIGKGKVILSTSLIDLTILEAIPLAASKSEENVDIFERRLSLVDQSLFEANSKKIRDAIARMRNRDLKTELDQKEYPKVRYTYLRS